MAHCRTAGFRHAVIIHLVTLIADIVSSLWVTVMYSGDRRESLPGIRHPSPAPAGISSSRSNTPGGSSLGRNDLVEVFKEQNSRLRHDVTVLEDKLSQALEILERYRELYGPLPN